MSEQSRLDAGARLASDLRRIRELRGLSIGDIHAETKIPRTLLSSFEERSLFDHSQFNRVYLRSFVRTYAASVGVEPEAAADALEEAFEGAYSGTLAQRYLDEPEPVADPDTSEAEAELEAPADSENRGLPLAGERPAASRRETSEKRASQPPIRQKGDPPPADEVDASWAETSPPARKVRDRPRGRRSSRRQRSGSRGWIYVLAGLIVVAILVWLFISVLDPMRSNVDEPSDQVADAGNVEEVAEEPVAPPREIPALGDSLVFFVVAAEDKVDPIRVTVDDDLRRPYWIDEGDSMRFSAAERIVFEDRLDVIRLNLQGESYPTQRRDDGGRIVVTRDSAEAFFQSLAQ